MPFFFVTGLSSDAPVPAEWVELGGGCTRGRCRRSTTRDMQTQRILRSRSFDRIPPRGRKRMGKVEDEVRSRTGRAVYYVRFLCSLSLFR